LTYQVSHSQKQFLSIARHGHIVVGPEVETLDYVARIRRLSYNQDRRRIACLPQGPDCRCTIGVLWTVADQYERGHPLPGASEQLRRCPLCQHLQPLTLERVRKPFAKHGTGFYQHDVLGHGEAISLGYTERPSGAPRNRSTVAPTMSLSNPNPLKTDGVDDRVCRRSRLANWRELAEADDSCTGNSERSPRLPRRDLIERMTTRRIRGQQ
jgi:hypothetical protein